MHTGGREKKERERGRELLSDHVCVSAKCCEVVGHVVDLPPAHSSLARGTPSPPSCRPITVLPCERELSTRLFSDSSPGHPSMTPKCPSFGCKTEHLGYFTFGVHSPRRITPHTKPDRVEPSQPPTSSSGSGLFGSARSIRQCCEGRAVHASEK
jgi:hypothetical protein